MLLIGAVSACYATTETSDIPQSSIGPPDACIAAEEIAKFVELELNRLIAEYQFAGFSYALARSTGVVASGGVGVADRKTNQPATSETVYQIGSITKTFTGVLLAKLVADDKIELGDSLAQHWPSEIEMPTDLAARPITLQSLATHTSGLPRYPENLERLDGDPMRGYSMEQMNAALENLELTVSFPAPIAYSNFGYGVLAQAIGHSQESDFADLFQSEIAQPLNLTRTRFRLDETMAQLVATPYRDDDPYAETQPWRMGAMSAAGGLFSTAEDLAKFAVWQLGSDEETFSNAMETRQLQRAPFVRYTGTTNWAYGMGLFNVDNYVPGADALWHGGDLDGYAGSFVLLPKLDWGLVYLTNVGKGDGFEELQQEFARLATVSCPST